MTLSVAPYAVYEFDNSGVDAVGNGPTLSSGGSALTYGAAKVGTHSVDGNASDNFTGYSFGLAVLAGNWTSCFWFKREIANNRTEFSFDDAVSKSTNFRVDRTGTGFYRMKTSNSSYIQDTTVAEDGAWHHAAFVFNGTQILYYMDGSLQGTKTYSLLPVVGGSQCYITVTASPGNNFSDQWAIFTTAITADDITYIYNGGTGRAYADWEIAASLETGHNRQLYLTSN